MDQGIRGEIRAALAWTGATLCISTQRNLNPPSYYYFYNTCNFYVITTLYAIPLGSKFQEKSIGLKARVLVSFLFPFIHLVNIYGRLLDGRYCTKC